MQSWNASCGGRQCRMACEALDHVVACASAWEASVATAGDPCCEHRAEDGRATDADEGAEGRHEEGWV